MEYDEILAKVKKFVKDDLIPAEKSVESEDAIPKDIIRKMKQLKLFGLNIPKEYGGLELTPSSEIEVLFQLGKTAPAFQAYFGTNSGIGSSGILLHGTKAQKDKYLSRIANGDVIVSFALTEESTGSDAYSIQCSAQKKGNGWVLNGKKRFITNAPEAGLFNVVAKTSEGKFTIFLVNRDNQGISVGSIDKKMGHRGSHTAEVILEDCYVGDEDVLGEVGHAMQIVMQILTKGRLTISAIAVGMCERLLSECTAYSRKRKQFNERICNFQLIKDKLAISATKTYATKCMVRDAANKLSNGQDIKAESAMCKYMSTEVLCEVADHAVQIFGGNGYLANSVIESFYRDARLFRIYEGTNEIQKLIIAGEVLRRKKI